MKTSSFLAPMLIAGLLLTTGVAAPVRAEVPVQPYEVVRAYPHDTGAFTEGLFFHDGALYESTGLYPSFIRKVDLETGRAERQRDLPTIIRNFLELTWADVLVFVLLRHGEQSSAEHVVATVMERVDLAPASHLAGLRARMAGVKATEDPWDARTLEWSVDGGAR